VLVEVGAWGAFICEMGPMRRSERPIEIKAGAL